MVQPCSGCVRCRNQRWHSPCCHPPKAPLANDSAEASHLHTSAQSRSPPVMANSALGSLMQYSSVDVAMAIRSASPAPPAKYRRILRCGAEQKEPLQECVWQPSSSTRRNFPMAAKPSWCLPEARTIAVSSTRQHQMPCVAQYGGTADLWPLWECHSRALLGPRT